MPGLAWLLCMIFHLKGATAAGVILVGSCQVGLHLVSWPSFQGGDVALDVSIETLSTLLAPLADSSPLVILGWSQYVSVLPKASSLSTLRIVVVPIILGVLVHSIFSKLMPSSKLCLLRFLKLPSIDRWSVVSANHANILQQRQPLSFSRYAP